MPRHTEQLPRDVVRDLLGIARALYASRRAEGASREELAKLGEAGALFVTALELSRTLPDTIGHRAAWSKADRATTALLEVLMAADASLAALVLAQSARLGRLG